MVKKRLDETVMEMIEARLTETQGERRREREKRWNGRGVPHIKSLFTGLEN